MSDVGQILSAAPRPELFFATGFVCGGSSSIATDLPMFEIRTMSDPTSALVHPPPGRVIGLRSEGAKKPWQGSQGLRRGL